MPIKTSPRPRSIQEWQERNGVNNLRLLEMIRVRTRRVISPALLSSIKSKSRRCSQINAIAISAVTGIDPKVLRRWPHTSKTDKVSGEGSNCAA